MTLFKGFTNIKNKGQYGIIAQINSIVLQLRSLYLCFTRY